MEIANAGRRLVQHGDVDSVRAKYRKLRGVMDERVTRLWAAAEAEALG